VSDGLEAVQKAGELKANLIVGSELIGMRA